MSPSCSEKPGAIFLTGPTASGKSELALILSDRLGGEIISVDSMQVYRGMDIGTAKPSIQDRARTPHHLVDILDLDQAFDVALFVQMARQAEQDIAARGRLPIFCGGTGLYFKAYWEGLGACPPGDPSLRGELRAQPLEVLLERLRKQDPVAYEKVDRNNPRRVLRALEIVTQTGRPLAETQAGWSKPPATADDGQASPVIANAPFFVGLSRPPEELRSRINRRVDTMFERGLVAETEELLKKGLAQNITASQALGYRQIIEHLEGQRSLSETIERVKARTRQFAKRQMTWFRTQLPVKWVEVVQERDLEKQAAFLIQLYQEWKKGLSC